MHWDRDNMGLNDERVWNLDGHMDREGDFHFLDDWNLDLLVHWVLLDVVMVNGVDVIGN